MEAKLQYFITKFVAIYENQLTIYNEHLKLSKHAAKLVGLPDLINNDDKDATEINTSLHQASTYSRFKQLLNLLYLFRTDPVKVRQELIKGGIAIFQCFECQFMQSTCEYGSWQRAMTKYAEDAVGRVFNYFMKPTGEEFSCASITKGALLGESRSSGSSFDLSNGWNTGEVFEQTGLMITNSDGTIEKYYKKDCPEVKNSYGFRQLFEWEMEDQSGLQHKLITNYKETNPPIDAYSYRLKPNDLEQLNNKLLDNINKQNLRENIKYLIHNLDQEAKDRFQEFETFVTANVEVLSHQIPQRNLKTPTDSLNQAKKSIWFDVREPVSSFVGRLDKLKQIADGLQKGIVVISGLSGMGKSELARKYAYDNRTHYNSNIVWINASSLETMQESFHRLAKQDQLLVKTKHEDGEEKPLETIVKECYDCFPNEKSLFIFDSADKCDWIETYLPLNLCPLNKKLDVLITSQLSTPWESKWLRGRLVSLAEFTNEEAHQLISTALSEKDDEGTAKLANLLHNFPLALHQAVAYIQSKSESGLELTINDYIEEYEKSKNYKGPASPHFEKISKTLEVTFAKLADPISREMLDIMSYLGPVKIPGELFLKGLAGGKMDKMANATEELEKYSIVQFNHGELSMHAIVQTARRQMLAEDDGKEEKVLSKTLAMLKNKVKEFDKIVVYLPHALALWNYSQTHDKLIEVFIVKDILEKKARTNYFHLIAGNGCLEVFKTILSKIETNFPGQFGNILCADDGQAGLPVHYAASNVDVQVLKLLIEKGAKVNPKKKHGWTPLLLAVRSGLGENVKVLLENSAQIEDTTSYGHTPLHLAARYGYPNIVEILLNNGAKINAKDKNMFTPLHFAAKMNHLKVVKLLLAHTDVDVDAVTKYKLTPLMFAAKSDHLECVEALFQRGANVNATDTSCFTSIHLAASNGHDKVVDVLLASADIDVNIQTTKGNTPLHMAAEKGHLAIVKALMAKGALVGVKNEEGKSASDVANERNHSNVVDYFNQC